MNPLIRVSKLSSYSHHSPWLGEPLRRTLRKMKSSLMTALLVVACRTRVDDVPDPARPVAVVGDSIIAQNADWTRLSPHSINMGVSGETTAMILERINKIPPHSSAVFLEGGVNELILSMPTSAIPINYSRMLSEIAINAAPDVRVYLIGILPVNERALRDDWRALVSNTQISSINSAIGEVCSHHLICHRIVLPYEELPLSDTDDGIHLNAHGYETLIATLRDALGT